MKKIIASLFPAFVMALVVIPSAFASTTYTNYSWSVSCNSNGTGVSTASWSWYANGPTGTSLGGGSVGCWGTASSTGTCPSQGVCSQGRPSNADTLIATVAIACGIDNSKTVVKSVTPGIPVSLTVSLGTKRGNCNGTYDRGTESGTLTINA